MQKEAILSLGIWERFGIQALGSDFITRLSGAFDIYALGSSFIARLLGPFVDWEAFSSLSILLFMHWKAVLSLGIWELFGIYSLGSNSIFWHLGAFLYFCIGKQFYRLAFGSFLVNMQGKLFYRLLLGEFLSFGIRKLFYRLQFDNLLVFMQCEVVLSIGFKDFLVLMHWGAVLSLGIRELFGTCSLSGCYIVWRWDGFFHRKAFRPFFGYVLGSFFITRHFGFFFVDRLLEAFLLLGISDLFRR